MKRFNLQEIWSLLKWILLFEVVLALIITLLNIFFDFEDFYKTVNVTSFISYEVFSLFILIIVEILGLTQIYLSWYKKYGIVKLSPKEYLKKLLNRGENRKIEFKSSLRWDFEKNEINKELEKPVIKTIAGFLNATGGDLLIGVTDEKHVQGLEKDYQTLPKKSRDGFENYITQIIRSNIGSDSLRLISFNFNQKDGKDVCLVRVKSSENPVYVKVNGSEEFFVRVGNSTASLTISEAIKYIQNHWKADEEQNNRK